MKIKKIAFVAAIIVFIVFIAACSPINPPADDKETVTVVDLANRKVDVPAKVQKVVCIGAGALRLFTYVGDLSMLCGVEDVDKDGTGIGNNLSIRPYKMKNSDIFNSLPSCGRGGPNSTADKEKILSCNPDVIFSMYNTDIELIDELYESTRIPVVSLSYGTKEAFDPAVDKSLWLIGKIIGAEERANAVVSYIASLKSELKNIASEQENTTKKSVYLGCHSKFGVQSIGSSSAQYSIFDASGIRNILDENGYKGYQSAIDPEMLLTLNPDIIILDAGGIGAFKNDYVKDSKKYSSLKAFVDGEVYLQMPYNAYFTNLEIAYADAFFAAAVAYSFDADTLDYVRKAREITAFFLGEDCYDSIANAMYGGYQKIDVSAFFAD